MVGQHFQRYGRVLSVHERTKDDERALYIVTFEKPAQAAAALKAPHQELFIENMPIDVSPFAREFDMSGIHPDLLEVIFDHVSSVELFVMSRMSDLLEDVAGRILNRRDHNRFTHLLIHEKRLDFPRMTVAEAKEFKHFMPDLTDHIEEAHFNMQQKNLRNLQRRYASHLQNITSLAVHRLKDDYSKKPTMDEFMELGLPLDKIKKLSLYRCNFVCGDAMLKMTALTEVNLFFWKKPHSMHKLLEMVPMSVTKISFNYISFNMSTMVDFARYNRQLEYIHFKLPADEAVPFDEMIPYLPNLKGVCLPHHDLFDCHRELKDLKHLTSLGIAFQEQSDFLDSDDEVELEEFGELSKKLSLALKRIAKNNKITEFTFVSALITDFFVNGIVCFKNLKHLTLVQFDLATEEYLNVEAFGAKFQSMKRLEVLQIMYELCSFDYSQLLGLIHHIVLNSPILNTLRLSRTTASIGLMRKVAAALIGRGSKRPFKVEIELGCVKHAEMKIYRDIFNNLPFVEVTEAQMYVFSSFIYDDMSEMGSDIITQ